MSAAATDKFTKVGNPGTATTLAAPGHTSGETSLTVVSTSNWPTDTGTIFAMDTVSIVNGVEVRDVGSYREYEGVVASSTSITGVTPRFGSDRDFAAGTTTRVYIPVAGSQNDRMVDGLLTSLAQDGTLAASGGTLTSPKIITGLNDTNNNELFKVTATGSAVNEFTVANAATGNSPVLSATGGDTDINIALTPKGNGLVKSAALRQDDTTNTYQKGNTVTLTGWGVITATATPNLTETVTFGLTFTQRPIVIAVSGGDNVSGTLTYGAGTAARNNALAIAHTVTTTNFVIRLRSEGGASWTSGDTVFYQWTAIGEM